MARARHNLLDRAVPSTGERVSLLGQFALCSQGFPGRICAGPFTV
jgi:hypothetical protein